MKKTFSKFFGSVGGLGGNAASGKEGEAPGTTRPMASKAGEVVDEGETSRVPHLEVKSRSAGATTVEYKASVVHGSAGKEEQSM
jgi:hypothetical protein